MKQSEKTKLTYDKIMQAAIVEFGTKTYDNASLNNICSDNNISKGLIYHNFKNKDELYLCCVKRCFIAITEFLSSEYYRFKDFNENVKKLINLRYKFFCANPYYRNIFFGAVLQPPAHLVGEVKKMKTEFDEFSLQQYKNIIENVDLREGITKQEALEFFLMIGEIYNQYYGSKSDKEPDFTSVIDDHEKKLSLFINFMMYGIAKESRQNDRFNH